ncbi:hypothetical protein F441_04889 [Phytophthora nicotianae CJ01A1]|uniref:Uncharacterized protein n=6 Tax=Phytophthora nicotianae TaxID=4792 RepID=W2PF97_PHYN3|nr:hypothetical protein PPTG_19209 [Phytophthora nicotianae INRA-310]ETI51882.1 hypothetical protein F443_04892 [Phytophthora nicotianae P1569]ETK91770.1 hypothetical protein L915_04757 [Phytophthora nicotianae]ETO80634.1 hypothetical protein F444_04930 [Phytophthora nicotianae P1976]ETP21664.1 hypothetical protein F441_04889 [Phytophthora nicotianae CJ01A1]ETP49556.1 hypothetical protein F442_04959 [Phytophthora nicotianae P10297]
MQTRCPRCFPLPSCPAPLTNCNTHLSHRMEIFGRGFTAFNQLNVLMPLTKILRSGVSDVAIARVVPASFINMKSLLRRFHRAPSSEANVPCSNSRQSRFSRSSRITQKAFVPAVKPLPESLESPTRSRKRDRLRNYLARRRESKTKDNLPYLWPAILSADKEEIRSSDDTEDGDDVYMVDYHSDSDSDDDSLCEDDYVTPPVAIPEMYRRQDRQGGITVAGARVLFTYAAFKRQQMMRGKLQSIPEVDQLSIPLGLHREHIVIGAY